MVDSYLIDVADKNGHWFQWELDYKTKESKF